MQTALGATTGSPRHHWNVVEMAFVGTERCAMVTVCMLVRGGGIRSCVEQRPIRQGSAWKTNYGLSSIRARGSGVCGHSGDSRQRRVYDHDLLPLRPSGYADALYVMLPTVCARCLADLRGVQRSAAVRCGAYGHIVRNERCAATGGTDHRCV